MSQPQPLKGGFGSFTTSSNSPFQTSVTNNNSAATPQAANAFGGFGAASGGTGSSAFGSTGSNIFGNKPAGSGLFGSSTTPASTPPSGGLFGNPAPTSTTTQTVNPTSAPAPPSGGFGFFGAKPAEPSSNAQSTGGLFSNTPPAPNNLFGANTVPASQPAAQQPLAVPSVPNLFGNAPKPAESSASSTAAPSSSSPASGGSLFGANLNFFKKPDAPSSSAPASTSATPAPSTSTATSSTPLFPSFGAPAAKKDDPPKDKDAAPATGGLGLGGGLFGQPSASKDSGPTAAAPSGFNLFGAKPTADQKDNTPGPAKEAEKKVATPALSLFGAAASGGAGPSPSSAAPASTTNATATAPTISVPPPSMLRGKTIEEIVNKWSSDLESHVQDFNKFAGEVAVWDRTLIDNGNTVAALFQHVALAEREQSDIEQTLQHVEEQQKELSETLAHYEKSDLFEGQGGGFRALDVGPADAERDKHYTLAADLTSNLDDLSRSLMQMIDAVNNVADTNVEDTSSARDDAPLEQIAQILSSHLESLQWIDNAVREVDSKVTDVEKRMRDASSSGTNSNSVGGGRDSNSSRPRGFGVR